MHILFFCIFFFNDTATTEIYTLSLHDALPIFEPAPVSTGTTAAGTGGGRRPRRRRKAVTARYPGAGKVVLLPDPLPRSTTIDRKSTRLNSSHANISYAVFCLKKKKKIHIQTHY